MTTIVGNGLTAPVSTDSHSKQGQPSAAQSHQSSQEKNAIILQAQLDVSLSSGNNSLALLYKTALQSLGEALEPTLGANAIEQIQQRGTEYYTPEATAERIVQLSTGFFERYRTHHPDQELEQQLDDFLELIGGGVDKGFAEAREILQGLDVLQGGIADNIDKTYELVFAGYDQFRSAVLDTKSEPLTTEQESGQPSSSQQESQSSAAIEQYRSVAGTPN